MSDDPVDHLAAGQHHVLTGPLSGGSLPSRLDAAGVADDGNTYANRQEKCGRFHAAQGIQAVISGQERMCGLRNLGDWQPAQVA